MKVDSLTLLAPRLHLERAALPEDEVYTSGLLSVRGPGSQAMSGALQAEPKYTQNGETVSPALKWCLQAVSAPRPQGTYWPLSCGVEHLFVSVLAASRACGERGEIQNPVMTTAGVSPTPELP